MNHLGKLDDPALLDASASKVADARRLLREIADDFSPAAFASSLGAEDMVLTDLIVRDALAIEIFSLDTGRLPAETYALIAQVKSHYGLALRLYYPRHDSGRGVDPRARHQRFLRVGRAAQGLLPFPQGRTAAARAGRPQGLDHRHARAAIGDPRRLAAAQLRPWQRRFGEIQPAHCVERTRSLGLPQAAPGAVQRPARPVLPEHRLRAVHARHHARRRCARRPLVVGESGIEGMRLAHQARLKPANNKQSMNHTGQS
jgi:hypothetical protein